ncbi:MAG: hypothetical protein JO336_21400 [Acidobacteriia bacterium]|nr:hypothetical protein [Terriglobia bacterium]
MRVPGTILGALALLVGFYQAPFAHIHVDDFDHPASTSPVHWHLHHDAPSGATPAISAPTADDDAIDIGWNAVKCSFAHISCDFAAAAIVEVSAVQLIAEPVQIPLRRGHDPPDLARKSPRSPPL